MNTVAPSLRLAPAQHDDVPMLEELMNLTIRPWVEVTFDHWNPAMARDSIQDDVVNQRASLVMVDEQLAGVLPIRDEPPLVPLVRRSDFDDQDR